MAKSSKHRNSPPRGKGTKSTSSHSKRNWKLAKYVPSTNKFIYILTVLSSMLGAFFVSDAVRRPYLDEVFHIPLASHYCNTFDFTKWDPKVTTPPGLYWFATAYAQLLIKPVVIITQILKNNLGASFPIIGDNIIVSYLSKIDPCSLDVLRSFNTMGLLIAFPLALTLLHKSQRSLNKHYGFDNANNTINTHYASLISFPLMYFFSFLFYTDVWSAIWVVFSLALGKYALTKTIHQVTHTTPTSVKVTHQSEWTDSAATLLILSSVCSIISLTFRQTNIVWTGYIVVSLVEDAGLLLQSIENRNKEEKPKKKGVSILRQDIFSFFSVMTYNMVSHGLPIILSFGPAFGLFAVFLTINEGITLGDKSNHEIAINFGQLLYLIFHLALFEGPVYVFVKIFNFLVSFVRGNQNEKVRSKLSFSLGRFLIKLFLLTISFISMTTLLHSNYGYSEDAHPFTLSDNRHYTFYIWRRIIQPCKDTSLVFNSSNTGFISKNRSVIELFETLDKNVPQIASFIRNNLELGMVYSAICAPFYMLGAWLLFPRGSNSASGITAYTNATYRTVSRIMFIVCICASLVPSPLLEPRYYMIPIIIWRTCHSPVFTKTETSVSSVSSAASSKIFSWRKQWPVLLEFFWYGFINFLTVSLFLFRTFKWPSEPTNKQRFMW